MTHDECPFYELSAFPTIQTKSASIHPRADNISASRSAMRQSTINQHVNRAFKMRGNRLWTTNLRFLNSRGVAAINLPRRSSRLSRWFPQYITSCMFADTVMVCDESSGLPKWSEWKGKPLNCKIFLCFKSEGRRAIKSWVNMWQQGWCPVGSMNSNALGVIGSIWCHHQDGFCL